MSIHSVATFIVGLLAALITSVVYPTTVGAASKQPITTMSVEPAEAGEQLVRTSLPFRMGALAINQSIVASDGKIEIPVALRWLTLHPGELNRRSIRRALVTFPYRFVDRRPVQFTLHAGGADSEAKRQIPVAVQPVGGSWTVAYQSGLTIQAQPIWPVLEKPSEWKHETIERNRYFHWERWKRQNDAWSQIVEVRADALGQVILIAHLQRRDVGGNWTPKFGWDLSDATSRANALSKSSDAIAAKQELAIQHSFETGRTYQGYDALDGYRINQPVAVWNRCGTAYASAEPVSALRYRYLRSSGTDRVPLQRYAWREAEIVISPRDVALPGASLTSPHTTYVDWKEWDGLYNIGPPLDVVNNRELAALYQFHRNATLACAAAGPDWGNLTTYDPTLTRGGVLGMNRLNHCPPIFFEGMRTGDHRLTETALAWCGNYHDLSVWWGPDKTGGTRYNNIRAQKEKPPEDNDTFMWRSDKSVDFCTKGFFSLLLAYEETGDPRMKEALDAQINYATQYVHCDQGEVRNIGDVLDFVQLYELTDERSHLDQALRLFRELREKLGPDNLFSQDGEPIIADPPFIDDDEHGRHKPFAKPYIIGYGLSGCAVLSRYVPDEPRLKEMIRAVADFMARSQDPIGGWRYPHPRSSSVVMSQALEHAWQLVQASWVNGAKDEYLDAIERVLRQRLWAWKESGQVLNLIHGWEVSSGRIKGPQDIYALYKHPGDRDPTKDYTEGRLEFQPCSPESLIYFPEVLRFYLQHRPASRLLTAPEENSPLGKVVSRLSQQPMLQREGVRDGLPVFYEQLGRRIAFPLAWAAASGKSFEQWQQTARQRVKESWQASPPDAAFEAKIVATRKCKGYQSHKIVFNLTGDSRVLAYLVVPDGKGPFPAVLLLHDHGGEQRIGKEKVVEPWDERPEKIELAHKWADKYYGSQFLGDELARRGYVCFATDALNWSDRGGAGQKGQQQLASNLMHFGMTFAGLIAHEDMRAADFLASRPEVDPHRIAAMGLSMGAFRTWQLAAMSQHISAGAAVCWMATVKGLMVPGGNQTEGHSAFTMTHPGLLAQMDYPDIASLACPKPMLFYNGGQDKLFPVGSVEDAYKKLHKVWRSQSADDRLTTKIWDVPHVFNREMQDEAFAWLDRQLTARAKDVP